MSDQGGRDDDGTAEDRLRRLDQEERDLYGKNLDPVAFLGHSVHLRRDEIEHERARIRSESGIEDPAQNKRTSQVPGWIVLSGAVILIMGVLALSVGLMR
ncbi:hypothetical protein C1N74_15990 (plasmid) [Microbacterium sp. SGAir0570]|nr:hypothetical protein C1N74_15990 [Microbacterium sp. SGAir0570]